MQNKSIVFAIAVSIGMQCGVMVASQIHQSSEYLEKKAQRKKSLSYWDRAKQLFYSIVPTVKSAVGAGASESTKVAIKNVAAGSTDILRSSATAGAYGVGSGLLTSGGLTSVKAAISGDVSSSIGGGVSVASGLAIQSLVNNGTITADQMKRIMLLGGGAIGLGVFSAAVRKIYASLMQKTITPEDALEQIKRILMSIVNNTQEFPTIKIKLDALEHAQKFFSQAGGQGNSLALEAVKQLRSELMQDPLFIEINKMESLCKSVDWDMNTINERRKNYSEDENKGLDEALIDHARDSIIDELAGIPREDNASKELENRINYLENHPVAKAIKSILINLKSEQSLSNQ
jgi:hypothetical protein